MEFDLKKGRKNRDQKILHWSRFNCFTFTMALPWKSSDNRYTAW